MKLGNVPSKLNILPGTLIKSGLGAAGDFFSDIMNMYRETQTQETSVALSQNAAIQAQALAQAQIAQAQAQARAASGGIDLKTQLLIAGAAIGGVLYFGKSRARRR